MYRTRALLGVVGWFAVVIGAGFWLARNDTHARHSPVPAMGFAGSDVVYVLRRVAAEAGVPLALDEVRPLRRAEDLRLQWVDMDLPSGTADRALRMLKERVGGFDYEFRKGVLYVRSQLELEADTGIDRGDLPGGTFEGDFTALGNWIQQMRPGTFVNVHLERGHPIGPPVRMRIAAGSSVLDVLLQYAAESGVGWRMSRAGQRIEPSPTQTAVVATEVTPWRDLDEPHHTEPFRQQGSLVQALAHLSERTATPFCVFDAAPAFFSRGTLDHAMRLDPGLTLEETLQDFAAVSDPRDSPSFRWEMRNGVVRVGAEGLDRLPWLAEVLHDPIAGGEFEGTVPELARWLTSRLEATSGRRIVGGEITHDGPSARVSLEPGTTVEEALLRFTEASGASLYFVVYDRLRPDAPPPAPWQGGFLSDLIEWGEVARPY